MPYRVSTVGQGLAPASVAGQGQPAPTPTVREEMIAGLPAEQRANVFQLQQQSQIREQERQARLAEQRRLEEENGVLGTMALQGARGALDALLAPGALLGAAAESLGSVVGSSWLEKEGRELGRSASGKSAIEAFGFVTGGGGRSGLREAEARVQQVEDQEQAWPSLSTASRMAGQAAFVLATAGAGAAGGATTGARVLMGMGALEGAAGGAQAAYEASAPLTDVLSAMALGGAIGTAGAGVGVLAGRAAGRLGTKVTPQAAEAFAPDLEQMAARSAVKSVVDRQSELAKVVGRLSPEARDAKLQRIGDDILNFRSEKGELAGQTLLEDPKRWSGVRSAEDIPDVAWAFKEEAGERLGNLRQALDQELGPQGGPDVKGLLQRIRADVVAPLEQEAKGFTRTEAQRDMRAVARALEPIAERLNLTETVTDAAGNAVQRRIKTGSERWWQAVDELPEGQARVGFAELEQMRRGLADRVYPKPTTPGVAPPVPRAQQTLQKVERNIAGHIDDTAEDGMQRLGRDPGDYQRAKDLYQSMKIAADASAKKGVAISGNRTVSITDYMTGVAGLAAGGPGGAIASLPMVMANRWMRQNGQALAAVHLRRAAASMQGEVQRGVGLFSKAIGVTNKALTEAPRTVPNAARAIGRGAATEHERWRQRQKALEDFGKSDIGLQMADAMQRMPGVPEELTSMVVSGAGDRLSKLLRDIPRARNDFRGPAYQQLSSQDVAKANAMYEATVDPLSIFEDYENGKVDYEKVKYVWQQWPGFQRVCQTAVVDMLMQQASDDQRAAISDTALSQLDYFFGFNGALQPTLAGDVSLSFSKLGAATRAEDEQQDQRPVNLPTTKPTMVQRMMRS